MLTGREKILLLALVPGAIVVTALLLYVAYLRWAYFGSPYIVRNEGVGNIDVLTVDGSKRSILINDKGVMCAEPSPDAIGTLAAKFAANVGADDSGKQLSGALDYFSQSDITKLFERSQGIQALRDGMYRLCEAHANDAIDNKVYEAQMSALTATLNFIVPIELCAKLSKELNPKLSENAELVAASAQNQLTDNSLDDLTQRLRYVDRFQTPFGKFMYTCVSFAHDFGIKVSLDAAERAKLRMQLKFHELELEAAKARAYEAFIQQKEKEGAGD